MLDHSNRMTEAEYDLCREEIRNIIGNDEEIVAKRDQALAILLHLSGWTKERLARKESKSRKWIVRYLRFGRFLQFAESTRSVPGKTDE